ncbi:dephospho-CoA kinase [Paenibacillus urinalis]|uniref:Dephospho-CoA kinase n=1 Tax=Paenibacillus urinalis TaxID=521520 RepID=A0ABY7XGP8_9BACL|nr:MULTISPECIES: dephospho-CoA kinase [Paenibacillus]WDH95729.1 dephospho-CoA kinase [Paenibacillus urinalis]WDI03926.1 dephospho-CoA kinase [Paenibacillus urinalis]GAK38726.1 dephospho-CoA kinase [Paenibacillus sp. TCA20]
MNIGLTGGIATGKSSVSRYLVSLGAILIDADQIAREVMLPGHPVLAAVIERFGQAVLNEDGTLHRKKLGEIVFGNSAELKALNDITHPAIRQEMRERMRMFEQEQPDKLVVSDIPLLYESGLSEQFEQVMVVYVPAEIQLKRLMERDGISESDAISRLNAQMDIEEKKRRADIVIDNSGTMEETKAQILKFWHDKGLS